MASNLQEFLVALGFKVDKAAFGEFERKVGTAEKLIGVMGGTFGRVAAFMGVSAGSIAFALGRVAKEYENLYYVSQRSGTAVTNIKSFQYATSQIGLTAEDATAALEGFAEALRMNPGKGAYATSLGATATDPMARMFQLFELWKKMNDSGMFFVAARQASVFGIDEHQLINIVNNLDKLRSSFHDNQMEQQRLGIDTDKLAGLMKDYEQNVRKLYGSWGLLTDLWVAKTLPYTQRLIDNLTKLTVMWSGDGLARVSGGAQVVRRDDESVEQFIKRYYESRGWSAQQAEGMTRRLKVESAFNPRAMGDRGLAYGVAQWHPDRQAQFAKWAGHDIRGSSLEEQLAFVDYELTRGNEQRAGRALRGAGADSYDVFTREYERPAGSGGVTLHQKTEINIAGNADRDTVDHANAEQERINSELVRNLGGAVR